MVFIRIKGNAFTALEVVYNRIYAPKGILRHGLVNNCRKKEG